MSSTSRGSSSPVTDSLVIIHSFTLSSDGTSNIASIIIDSIIARSPLAPVFLSTERFATAAMASSSNDSFTLSNSNNFLYCFVIAFLGSTRILFSASSSSKSSATLTGSLPISSGIMPNLTKSSGSTWRNKSPIFSSLFVEISALKPMDFLPIRVPIIFSRPSNAPPQINNIFVVSIW